MTWQMRLFLRLCAIAIYRQMIDAALEEYAAAPQLMVPVPKGRRDV